MRDRRVGRSSNRELLARAMTAPMPIDRRRLLGYGALTGAALTLAPTLCAAARAATGATSVLRFIPASLHQDIFDGTARQDLSRFIDSAVDSGENLYFPGKASSRYPIDGQIQIRQMAQYLTSSGLVRLDFIGRDVNANAIEILSGRRDLGSPDETRQAQSIAGFRVTGPEDARYASMIFVEEGTFYPRIERIFSEAGTNRGYFGQLRDSFLRVQGTATSYVNDVTIRDCVFAGVGNPANPHFPGCGIWIEGCIEGRVENTKVFYFDECMRLGNADGSSRNVQFMVFDQVQLEPTMPYDQADGQAALNIFLAHACNFRDCRFAVGNGPAKVSSVAVRVSGVARQIRFRDCSFQGFRRARNLLEVTAAGSAVDLIFTGADIRDFLGDWSVGRGRMDNIMFDSRRTGAP